MSETRRELDPDAERRRMACIGLVTHLETVIQTTANPKPGVEYYLTQLSDEMIMDGLDVAQDRLGYVVQVYDLLATESQARRLPRGRVLHPPSGG